jgi:hypothetical protein
LDSRLGRSRFITDQESSSSGIGGIVEDIVAVLDEREAGGEDAPERRAPGKNAAILDVTLYLESTLALLVRSFGGQVEEEIMSSVAERFLCALAYKYIDGLVLKATNYWDIEYERKDASGLVVRRCTSAG